MIPLAARNARRSRRGVTTRNSRLPSIRSDSQIFVNGPAHGSRRSIHQGTALPIVESAATRWAECGGRSEEHTSELQSHSDLVCRLLLEKKNADATPPSVSSGPPAQ